MAVTGLASGMNWSTVVAELANAERSAETQWKNNQTTITTEKSAYSTISTDLTTLQTDAKKLMDPSFFDSVTAASSDSSAASALVTTGAAAGDYIFNITQLATAAQMTGASQVSQVLASSASNVTLGAAGFSTAVTAGTFTVNGAQVTVSTTDSLQDVFDAIAKATSNKVTASYNSSTDEISLASSAGSAISLGSAADTSNFLSVAQLYNDNGTNTENTGTVTSTAALGRVNTKAALKSADLQTTISDGGSGSGQFKINGVAINFDASTDSIGDVLTQINDSSAGVTAAYDTVNNQFVLKNKTTGNVGISMADVTGNFLTATGLSAGKLTAGKNLLYTLNGSSQTFVSQSNTISSASSGIADLTVTAAGTGSTTVTVASDTSTISSAIQQFVKDYTALQSYMTTEQSVSTGTDGAVAAGTLTGDSITNDIVSSLRSTISSVLSGTSGTINQLADLGFQSSGSDNTITLSDATKLTNALSNNLDAVKKLFSDSTSGLATQMNKYITNVTSDSGALTTRVADLTKQYTDLTTQIANMETKVSNDTTQWDSEFSAMETAESTTNQELTYISQMVSAGTL